MNSLSRLAARSAIAATLTALVLPASASALSWKRPERPPLPTAAVTRVTADEVALECGSEDALGCSDGERVWLGPDAGRWTRAHELAHVADARSMSDQERAAFMKLLPIVDPSIEPDAGWWGYDDQGAYIYGGAEVFADATAACYTGALPQPHPDRHGRIIGSWPGSYGYDPDTNARQRRICARIARWLRSPRP